VLVAIGGNSLVRDGDASISAQRERIEGMCEQISELAALGWRIVVTHGNGPQVGAALLRSERAAAEAYPVPLHVCVAATQGETGFLLADALGGAVRTRGLPSPVAAVVTAVVVSARDPSFDTPTKPVGPFYPREQADAHTRNGWRLAEQPTRGWRRVVASPEPLEILEEPVIRTLLDSGCHVITLGGGGVPVVRKGPRLEGVDAVIDKDLSSALLANNLRADLFVILTDVDGIYLDFATAAARRLESVGAEELRAHMEAGHFAPGSMEPKVEAVLRFIESGGARAVVALPEHMADALAGSAGTNVYGERTWTGSER
jgi:carbamate kinase